MKNETDINKELLEMKKKDQIGEALYTRLRSTGAQPARLYRLAKVHKEGTPLQYRGNPSQLLAAKVRQISGNKKIENMLAIPKKQLPLLVN